MAASAASSSGRNCAAPTALRTFREFSHRFRGGLASAAPTALVMATVDGKRADETERLPFDPAQRELRVHRPVTQTLRTGTAGSRGESRCGAIQKRW